MLIRNALLAATLLAATPALAFVAATPALAFDGWHTENVTAIPSKTSSYDYITYDSTNKHLFLGHRGEGLQVFDPVEHKLVTTLAGTPEHSSNGVTVIADMDMGVVNNEDGTAIPFKLSTLAMGETVKLAEGIDTSHYDPSSKHLFFNTEPGKDGTPVIVVDPTTMKKVTSIMVATKKAEGAAADGAGKLYLSGQTEGKIFVIDTNVNTVTATWSSPACAKPTMIEVDARAKRLFVSCRALGTVKAALVVLNTENGATVWSAEIGDGSDGLAYDEPTHRLFSTNGVHANLTVAQMLSPDSFKIIETLGTYNNAKVIAMDHENQKLYTMVAEGSANTEKKINTAVSPYAANTVFPNSFRVITISK
jgi:outer membrane protein assembly factor BamB